MTPSFESKFTTQVVLDSLSTDDKRKAMDKEKSQILKHAHHIPVFPGSKCKTEPDLWEDWWERVYGIQNALNCSDYFLGLLIKHTATKDSELYHDNLQEFRF